MKITIKAILLTVLFAGLGIGFHYIFKVANGFDSESNKDDEIQNIMVSTRDMFLYKNEEIQALTKELFEDVGLRVSRDKNNNIINELNYNLDKYNNLNKVMSEYNGNKVYNIAVTNEGVYYYTAYTKSGVVGVVYENVLGNTNDYETLEVVQNWKLFFQMNE